MATPKQMRMGGKSTVFVVAHKATGDEDGRPTGFGLSSFQRTPATLHESSPRKEEKEAVKPSVID